jgi:hypothetical protein
MDGVIHQIANMNLNNVGAIGKEQEKRNILAAIRAVPPDFKYESIEGITAEDIEEFNAAKLEIDRAFQEAFQQYGCHGALNCGKEMKNYIAIRQTFQQLDEGMEESRSYTATLRFITSSMLALPAKNIIHGLDKPSGEKTFSKMCLNLAVKLSLDRLNWIEGYWTKKQMTDFKDNHD